MVEMRSHLAIQRARLVTLHLQQARRSSIPTSEIRHTLQERKLQVAKRRYSKEFRQFAVERLRGCENIVALAKELHVSRRQLYRWRDELDPEIPGMELPGQNARASTLRKEVNHLKRVLAEKTLEVDFFKSALQKVEARRQQNNRFGEKASTSKSRR